jgi:NAD(P)-dependent dehydrogenase (short-subunit alcohol dehydrogenase family)
MQQRFGGTVALVTGAGRGIGLAVARRFARDGARVVLNDVDAATAEAGAAAIRAEGGEALAVAADVSDKAAVTRLFDTALERYGDVNALVNNAGLTNVSRHFLEGDEAWWDQVLDTNLKSVFLCSHRAAWLMARRTGGSIVNISSGGASKAHRGNAAYDAAKGGIEAVTRAMAVDLAPYGIRVNAVAPGSIVTSAAAGLPEEQLRERGRVMPLGRLGDPDEVAGPIVFLCSEDARYMTGHVLVVDGGLLAQQRSPQVDIFPLERYPVVEKE